MSKGGLPRSAYINDAADQLLTQSVAGVAKVTKSWSPNGVLASATTPAGTTVYTSDLMDELVSLTLEDGTSVGYTHDAQGNRTSRTVDGVLDATWAWDEASSLPVRIGGLLNGQVSSLTHAAGFMVVDAYGITRDTRGNPTKVDITTASGTTSAVYGYDAVSRLTSECYPATGVVCGSSSPSSSYTYDKVGNRATESARTVAGGKVTTVKTVYAYDPASQLLKESVGGVAKVTNTWSPNGVLATSTTPEGTKTYVSDLTDELVSLAMEDGTSVGYTHDAQGNPTSRTVDGVLDVAWAWDELSALPVHIGETDAAGTLTSSWLPDPTSSAGTPLAETTGGASSWMLSDSFLNVAASVSTSGVVSGTRGSPVTLPAWDASNIAVV